MLTFFRLFYCLFFSTILCAQQEFDKTWEEMQMVYGQLSHASKIKNISDYIHPNWQKELWELTHLIGGKSNNAFLQHPSLIRTMVRKNRSIMQEYEIFYLKQCLSTETSQKLKNFSETRIGMLPVSIPEFNCTTNSLGHLYYAARLFEETRTNNDPLKTIVDFGGGYGNLARILKMVHPQSTFIIIDFPELIALQYLYLRSSLPHQKIVVHKILPQHITSDGAIHLVPVFFVPQLQLKADTFISTFGLSEAPALVQNLIVSKNFFNAKLCYIAGQINGWQKRKGMPYVAHTLIQNAVRAQFKNVNCQPFHSFSAELMNTIPSYEMMATR